MTGDDRRGTDGRDDRTTTGRLSRRGLLVLGGAVVGGAALGGGALAGTPLAPGRLTGTAGAGQVTAPADDGATHQYRVTVTNHTRGQPFTPPVVALHQPAVELFSVGDQASEALRELAENGMLQPLLDVVAATPEVRAAGTGDGPLVPSSDPGGTGLPSHTTLTLSADRTATHLSFASMLVATNDGFTGLDTVRLPERVNESRTLHANAYDAGTERNTERFADLVPPAQTLVGGSGGAASGDSLAVTYACDDAVARLTVANTGTRDGFLRDVDAAGLDVLSGEVPLAAGAATTLEIPASGTVVLRLFDEAGDPLGPPVEVTVDCASRPPGTTESDSELAEDGVVRPHPGVRGDADLSPSIYGWDDPVATVHVEKVAGGPTPVVLFEYDAEAGALPENVAVDAAGVKYVSFPPVGEIRAIGPDDATESVFASFTVGGGGDFPRGVTGVATDGEGGLFAGFVAGTGPDADTHGVWRVAPDGSTSLFAEIPAGGFPPATFPNDLLVDGDSLLVTDSIGGQVWRVRAGEATLWVADDLLAGTSEGFPIGANGITPSPEGVYVANTEQGHVVEIPVLADGSAGTPEVFVADPLLGGIDGMTRDVNGDLYVAVNFGNAVRRVSPDGAVETLFVGDPLDGPADVAFGTAPGTESTLYVPNLAFQTTGRGPSFVRLDVERSG